MPTRRPLEFCVDWASYDSYLSVMRALSADTGLMGHGRPLRLAPIVTAAHALFWGKERLADGLARG